MAASLVGVIDEGIRKLIPSRMFDPVDILFNVDPLKLNAAPTIFTSAVVVGECSWFF